MVMSKNPAHYEQKQHVSDALVEAVVRLLCPSISLIDLVGIKPSVKPPILVIVT